ncbi:hypothetical protein [Clostridium botulinum]|uniref:hypothetical protein n=1 Tax=Clostridium botulinum TaxID=1491 RepID=UPI0004B0F823|nr:hypothetical protein [Clostridium botulinum]QDY27021.1 hypothetical protein CGQ40_20165 [Clostridium botulinum]
MRILNKEVRVMGIRRRTARTSENILGTNYKEVLNKAKVRYRCSKEFYIFKAYEGSDFWCAESHMINPSMAEEHWIFNEQNNRWYNESK